MNPTCEEVETYLKGLGSTATEVAATLRLLGIRGRPKDNTACPIAKAIKRKFDQRVVYVNRLHITLVGCLFDTPPTVLDFIDQFDSLQFPELQYLAAGGY